MIKGPHGRQFSIHVAGEVEDKQKSRFQWHSQCAISHVAKTRLSIILVLPNTVIVWPGFCYSLVKARSFCKKSSYTLAWSDGMWYALTYLLLVSISQIVSSIKMRLYGSNNCVVAKQHGLKWKPGTGSHHMDLEYTLGPCHMWHRALIDVTCTENM